MFRKSPTSGPFSSTLQMINERLSVWNKGHIVPGQDPDFIRSDDFGNLMSYSHFGNAASEYGWEIDYAYTESFDEDDAPAQRPIHFKSRREARIREQ